MGKLTVGAVLDTIRDRHDLKSDYAIGKMTGIGLTVISNWRSGRSHPDERMCAKLAEAAGLDPLVLAAAMQAQRSKTAEARSMWEQVAERLALASRGAVAAVFAAVFAMGLIAATPEDSRAGELPTLRAQANDSLYIVSSLLALVLASCAWLRRRPAQGFSGRAVLMA